MAKYSIDFEFVPTLDNAPDLLMDLAAMLSGLPKVEQAVATEADHSGCVLRADAERLVADATAPLAKRVRELEWALEKVTVERNQLIANAEKAHDAATLRGMPHVGELVKILPNPGNPTMYGGVVKRILGRGGTNGIEVLPKGHGRTVVINRKYIKRYAVEERATAQGEAA